MENEVTEEKETKVEASKEELDKIIKYHVWGSIGVGLIPVPFADFVALTAIQLNMLRKIAKAYNVPFSRNKVRNILSSLIGGALAPAVSTPLAVSMAKVVPVIGTAAGIATMPVISGAVTYAVGKVLIQHFASGGTFLTFDPEKVKAYYEKMLKEGEEVAKDGKEIAADIKEKDKAGKDKKESKDKKEDKGKKKS